MPGRPRALTNQLPGPHPALPGQSPEGPGRSVAALTSVSQRREGRPSLGPKGGGRPAAPSSCRQGLGLSAPWVLSQGAPPRGAGGSPAAPGWGGGNSSRGSSRGSPGWGRPGERLSRSRGKGATSCVGWPGPRLHSPCGHGPCPLRVTPAAGQGGRSLSQPPSSVSQRVVPAPRHQPRNLVQERPADPASSEGAPARRGGTHGLPVALSPAATVAVTLPPCAPGLSRALPATQGRSHSRPQT